MLSQLESKVRGWGLFSRLLYSGASVSLYNMYHPRTGIDSVRESGSQSFKGRTPRLAVTFLVCL